MEEVSTGGEGVRVTGLLTRMGLASGLGSVKKTDPRLSFGDVVRISSLPRRPSFRKLSQRHQEEQEALYMHPCNYHYIGASCSDLRQYLIHLLRLDLLEYSSERLLTPTRTVSLSTPIA